MIERDNAYFIINKKQKENMINNNIDFNAVPYKKIPYQIDKLDNEIINLTLFKTSGELCLSLEEGAESKTISYVPDSSIASLSMIRFINNNKIELPKIHLKEHEGLKEISYYITKTDYTKINKIDNITNNINESQKNIKEINIKHNTLSSNSLNKIHYNIKHKEEDTPVDIFDAQKIEEQEYDDYDYDDIDLLF